ncbi:MAG: carboxy terminal-processing peptidase, partial [Bacteroidales bacterium]
IDGQMRITQYFERARFEYHPELLPALLKLETLEQIYQLDKPQNKQKEKNDTVVLKTFEELEQEARKTIIKRYDVRFKRLEQLKRQDRFQFYINSILSVHDPHTGYYPPQDKQDFDIQISGKLEGIGATLSEKDGFITVENIVLGSASWKQGQLQVKDVILKVAQENEEPVDVVNMRLDEVVKLIRGPKGTKVTLSVKKIDGRLMDIEIIRDVVILEETFARSTIITDNDKKRIGYIFLPKFYVDFNDANGRKCSVDVLEELQKLKNQNVEGIIFDVRNNGGGSLNDVVKIAGYFIPSGPIVQVKSRNQAPQILTDNDAQTIFSGPLIILVNEFSASASEILAAALQDYNRAIIVGSSATYGKGTVQRFLDLDNFLTPNFSSFKPLGHMKVTIQKFYRIDGGTTQLKGVIPDIILKDNYSYLEIGEKELDNPMGWDEIPSQVYQLSDKKYNISKLIKNSTNRIQKDSTFLLIEKAAVRLKNQKEFTNISLNYNNYMKNKKDDEKIVEEISKIGKKTTALEIISMEKNSNTDTKIDSIQTERLKQWHEKLKKDPHLFETLQIMKDMIKEK